MDSKNADLLIEQFLHYCQFQKYLSLKTIKAYKIDLAQFADYIQNDFVRCDKQTMQCYLAVLHKRYKVKSIKRKIATLKAFYNYLENDEVIEVTPFDKLRIKLHEPVLLPRTIPLNTINLLLQYVYSARDHFTSTCTYQYRASLRDIAVLELLFATGMRVSELCSLRQNDVDLSNGVVKIWGKGSRERVIQLGTPCVVHAIRCYHELWEEKIQATGWFFVNRIGNKLSDQSIRNMISKYAEMAGIDQHITPHMFRHTFATLLLEEDVDIRFIQQLLGHCSITTTQIYTHVTTKKQRDILTQKHPRNKITI